jgi:ubiquinone/menaquinone biosynthesis C-methylase UbiE
MKLLVKDKMMFNFLKKKLLSLFHESWQDNQKKFLTLLKEIKSTSLLDLGCGDGEFTIKCGSIINANDLYGIDFDDESLKNASKKDVKVIKSDLNDKLPFKDELFDVVISNQVIEAVYNPDNFVKEICRVLKKNGICIVSTENLASWHNIFALILGYQDFSSSYSVECKLGNPLSPIYMKYRNQRKKVKNVSLSAHVRIPTSRSLKEIFEIHGFKVEKLLGAGYYPFPSKLSSFFATLNPSHSHFITLKAIKLQHVKK